LGRPGGARGARALRGDRLSQKANYFKLNNRHTTIPTLDQSALRDLYQQTAALKLDEAIKADEAAKKAIEEKKAYEKMIRDSRRHPGEV